MLGIPTVLMVLIASGWSEWMAVVFQSVEGLSGLAFFELAREAA